MASYIEDLQFVAFICLLCLIFTLSNYVHTIISIPVLISAVEIPLTITTVLVYVYNRYYSYSGLISIISAICMLAISVIWFRYYNAFMTASTMIYMLYASIALFVGGIINYTHRCCCTKFNISKN